MFAFNVRRAKRRYSGLARLPAMLHGCTLVSFVCANRSAAARCSDVSHGQLSRSRSQGVPAATQARSVSTGNRVPANTGVPPRTSGSDVTWGGCEASNFFSRAVNVSGGHGFTGHECSRPELGQALQQRGRAEQQKMEASWNKQISTLTEIVEKRVSRQWVSGEQCSKAKRRPRLGPGLRRCPISSHRRLR